MGADPFSEKLCTFLCDRRCTSARSKQSYVRYTVVTTLQKCPLLLEKPLLYI